MAYFRFLANLLDFAKCLDSFEMIFGFLPPFGIAYEKSRLCSWVAVECLTLFFMLISIGDSIYFETR